MIVKVCGMREDENIRQIDELGIEWMGFIFYEQSKRHITRRPGMPQQAKAFGVFVDYSIPAVLEKVEGFSFQGVQLHGSETPEYCQELRRLLPDSILINKAFGIATADDFQKVMEYEGYCDYYIFDTKTPAKGGSGISFDWSVLENYKGTTPFLLSGGIGPDSIEDLKAFHHPRWAGVDLNSKFEIEPALKDVDKLNTFIKKFRNNE